MPGRGAHSVGKLHTSLDRPREISAELHADRIAGVRAALVEVSNGVVIPVEAVEKWIESWDTPDELPMPKPVDR